MKDIKFRETKNGISPRFFGFFEKRKRKELGYSLENVSKDLFMSKGNLSEMENGIRMMKKDVFDRFLHQYDIQFDTDLNRFFEMKEILIQIVDCFLRFDKKKQEKVREHFEALEGNWKNTYGCFIGELIQYFIQIVMDHQKGDEMFHSLVLIENCLSNDEKALLY
uniref:helix-turn-helix domain-containing protein n=1 Tax=uncultured Dubosiella sp. TaxID=1937011 RepID=UPI002597B55E